MLCLTNIYLHVFAARIQPDDLPGIHVLGRSDEECTAGFGSLETIGHGSAGFPGDEHTISQLEALASLMPIVAGIGGNTGNQTITMIVRALALQQIQPGNFSFLILREMGVALINGLVWGGIMGCVTWLLYSDPHLGAVMTLAMVLNLLVAALMGVLIPMIMVKFGRDPAVGSSVMITAITDTGGFFIFLGLATIFLL